MKNLLLFITIICVLFGFSTSSDKSTPKVPTPIITPDAGSYLGEKLFQLPAA